MAMPHRRLSSSDAIIEREADPTESSYTARMQSAGVRAMDAYDQVTRAAKKVAEEIDDVTAPHGVPTIELSEEDSMVTSIAQAREQHAKDNKNGG